MSNSENCLRFDTKMKHNFKQKALEKQFEVNENFLRTTRRAISAISSKQVDKTKSYLEDLKEDLEEHSNDIIAADFSRNGWLTVARVRNRSALPAKLIRLIEKEDDIIDRRKKSTFKPPQRTSMEVNRQIQRPPFNPTRPIPGQKKSLEQLLLEATKQTRVGQCSFCNGSYHFHRECPSFWNKVLEQRKENGKN